MFAQPHAWLMCCSHETVGPCRQWPERLPHIPMAVPDFRPFSGLTSLELSGWRLGNLALLPSLIGLVRRHASLFGRSCAGQPHVCP